MIRDSEAQEPSSTVSTSTSTSTPQPIPTAADFLEELSRDIVRSIKTRTFDTLLKYASPGFIDSCKITADIVATHVSSTAINAMKQWARTQSTADVYNSCVDLNEKLGITTVFLTMHMTGRPSGTKKENVIEFKWRREEGAWVCVRHVSLTAIPRIPH